MFTEDQYNADWKYDVMETIQDTIAEFKERWSELNGDKETPKPEKK